MKKYLYILAFFILSSCSSSFMGKDIYGADEFVVDSYKIKDGKFSILEMEGVTPEPLSGSLLEEYEDTIQDGDVLKIAIYHPKREDIIKAVNDIGNNIGYKVLNGKIYLPEIGAIDVINLTLTKAKYQIENRYKEEISDIEVFIAYKERIIKKVELAGLVHQSTIPVDGKIRLFDVLSVAKVPPEANLFKSYIVRENKMLSVDFYKLLKEGDMSQNIIMRGGDKIYIAESSASRLMVMGDVSRQCLLDLPSGSISLREALAAAGGIPFTGDKSYIQVIRGNILQPKIYVLSWQHVIHLPNNSLLLMPGDIVYVASKPITEWNRFVSQILPTFGILEVVTQGIKNVGIIIP